MKARTCVGSVCAAAAALAGGQLVFARQEPPGQAVAKAVQARPAAVRPVVSVGRHDVSAPLRSITPRPSGLKAPRKGPLPMRPVRKGGAQAPDAALESAAPDAAAPATIINFEGVSNVDGVLPPDTNGDIGPNHYVQWVNKTLAVYSRSGALLYGPASGNTIWAGFGGPCETQNDGDPIVLYDHLADRWLLLHGGDVPGG